MVQLPPGIANFQHLGAVRGHVVAQRHGALGTQTLHHTSTRRGLAANHAVFSSIDDSQVSQRLQGQRGLDLGQRGRHHVAGPGAVVRVGQALALPGLARGVERGHQVRGEGRAGPAGLHHLAQVVPGTHGKQRVRFARRIADGGLGPDAQHMAGHLGMQLAHKRSAPQLIQRVGGLAVAWAVNPVGGGLHFRATRTDRGHLLR